MAQQAWTREWLRRKGYKDDEIGYDDASKTVLVRNQPFVKVDYEQDGKSYASTNALENAFNKLNPLTQGPGNRVQRYQSTVDSSLSEALQRARQPFSYNPQNDPRYQAAVKLAQRSAQQASRSAMEDLNSRGILNSTVTSDRLGQIQQDAMGDVSARLVPELYASALQERQQDINNIQSLAQMMANIGNNERDYNRNVLESDRNFGLQKSDRTGVYVPDDVEKALQELVQLKFSNRAGNNPEQAARANVLRDFLNSRGVDSRLFGADVTPEQAAANLSRIGTPTLQALQQAFNQEIARSGATGYFDGSPTLDREQLNLMRDKFNWEITQPRTSTTEDRNSAYSEAISQIDLIRQQSGPEVLKKFFQDEKANLIAEFGLSGYNQLYNMYFDEDGEPRENPVKPSGVTPQSTRGLSYTNLWKTQREAANAPGFRQFNTLIDQAIAKTGVPASWKPYLTELFGRESTWNPNAKNPNSTAYGYAQFLDSTRADYANRYGIPYDTPLNQLILGIQYVKDRYGDPVKALTFWDQNQWY